MHHNLNPNPIADIIVRPYLLATLFYVASQISVRRPLPNASLYLYDCQSKGNAGHQSKKLN